MAVVKVFFDIDMRLGIDGLSKVMKSAGVKPATADDMMMFMNRRKTYVKILWDGRFVLQLRKPNEEGRLTLEEIRTIPGFFKGSFMNSTIEQRIVKTLGTQLKVRAA